MRPLAASSLLASLPLLVLAVPVARAQEVEDDGGQRVQRNAFSWEGRVPDGRWLYLRNLNGGVRVEPGSGDRVVVTAEKRWRRGDPATVRVVQRPAADGQGVVVCTVYEGGACDERDYRSGKSGGRWWGSDNNDVSVSYTVRVPRGVKLDLETTNGGLEVRGAGGEIVGRTTNGGIQIDGGAGPVRAHTTNGGVAVRLSALAPAGDFDLETTNGGVSLTVPASLGAEVDMSTTNGGVSTDFPVTVQGRINPRRLQATLGNGGRRVRMRTTNGGVSLRRAD